MTKTIDDRYRLEERIGAGGMGEVWRGTDLRLKRQVAVKMLHESLRTDADQAARFHAEARTIAQIHHSNVVRVYDFGHTGESAYIVMDFIEGRSLGAILREEGKLTVERTAAIMAQAAEALHAVHKRGVVHRDVKPDNLIVQEDGTVVLTDFGIARHDMSMTLTATGTVIGTAYYMSPEQVSGERPLPASDQYSLGIVTYRCLAGELPFDGDTPISVAVKQLKDPVPELPKGMPSAMSSAVMKALRKKADERWPDCAAYGRALLNLIPKGETTASLAVAKSTLAKTRDRLKGSAPVTKPGASLPVAEKSTKVQAPVKAAAAVQQPTRVAPKTALPKIPAAAPPKAPVQPRKKGGMNLAVLAVVAGVVVLALALYLITREGDKPNAGDGGNGTQSQNTEQNQNNGGDPNNGGDEHGTDPGNNSEQSPNTGDDGNDDNGGNNGSDQPTPPPGTKSFEMINMTGWDKVSLDNYMNKHHTQASVLPDENADPITCLTTKQWPEIGTVVYEGATDIKVWVHPDCVAKYQ